MVRVGKGKPGYPHCWPCWHVDYNRGHFSPRGIVLAGLLLDELCNLECRVLQAPSVSWRTGWQSVWPISEN